MNIILHVGIPKAGTTWIQKEIFEKFDKTKVNYVRGIHFHNHVYPDKINIFSAEGFYNDFLDLKLNNDRENNRIIANRLCACYPDAKVIFGKRESNDWINSVYRYYIRLGGTDSYESVKEQIEETNLLDFDGYEKHIKNLWNDVYVYDYSDMVNNLDYFVSELCYFIDADLELPEYTKTRIKKGWNDRQIKLGRKLNKYFKTLYNLNGIIKTNNRPIVRKLIDKKINKTPKGKVLVMKMDNKLKSLVFKR